MAHGGRTATIYTFQHNTHKLVPNMMWWAENAIIMKFTRGKNTHTHNVTIHFKRCGGEISAKTKKECESERERASERKSKQNEWNERSTIEQTTHCITYIKWFSFVVPSFTIQFDRRVNVCKQKPFVCLFSFFCQT